MLIGPAGLPTRGVALDLLSRVPLLHVHSPLSVTEHAILWQIRLPRIALGGIVGLMLAASGAAYQGVFRNPLADPYLLGAAAGAGLGATIALAYGGVGSSSEILPIAAFSGALLAVACAYALARTAGPIVNAGVLILAG